MSPNEQKPFVMQTVKSSNIAQLGYDPATQELRVQFAKGGLFSYAAVPRDRYEELRAAPSIGAYFAYKIRPHFKSTDLRAMSPDAARAFLNKGNGA